MSKSLNYCPICKIISCFLLFALLLPVLNAEAAKVKNSGIYDDKNDEVAGVTALMSAVVSGDIDGVRFFSKAGKIMVNQKNLGGATALHLACREKDFEMVKILVDNGADINAVDKEGWTPLMRASLSSSADIVELLLKNGAQGSAINLEGESAIIHAALSDCSDCLNLMLGSFDFIGLMDTQLLKNQLTEAFIITKNHENAVGQGLIESYLDRVIKSSPLVTKAPEINDSGMGGKTFRITQGKAVKNKKMQPIKEPQPEVSKEPEKTFIIHKDLPPPPNSEAPSSETKSKPLTKNVAPSTAKPSLPNKAKTVVKASPQKFKFVTGPEGMVVKESSPAPIYKIVVGQTAKKNSPITNQSGAKTFKFIAGPTGQADMKQNDDETVTIDLNK